MPRGSSPKRERQYEHIKESAEQRGESTKRAKEIASRTVNKERARACESKQRAGRPRRTSRRPSGAASVRTGVLKAPLTTSCTRRPSVATSKGARP